MSTWRSRRRGFSLPRSTSSKTLDGCLTNDEQITSSPRCQTNVFLVSSPAILDSYLGLRERLGLVLGHGWRDLVEEDFAKVNSADDTWSWKDGVLYCTGKPISVMRTIKLYTNVEIAFEWNHRKPAGNSGLFVWADKEKIEHLSA